MATQSITKVPAGWSAAACKAWAANDRALAVQTCLDALQGHKPPDPRLCMQAVYYLFLQGQLGPAATVLEKQYQQTPDNVTVAFNLGMLYGRLGRHAEAVPLFEQVLRTDAAHYSALDGLCHSLHRLGRLAEAASAGTRALALKHAASACGPVAGWALPAAGARALAEQPGKRHVISFSLWGRGQAYLRGALRNVLVAQDIYPGWVVQLHVDPSVPEEFAAMLRGLGAEVVMHPADQPLREKLCWRFAAANDPTVGRFLVRDTDSVLSTREALAVQQWVDSDRHFHVMRDWWSHTDLMLAGMWGGVAGVLPDLLALLRAYRSPMVETPNIDQWFLRDRVWPMVRTSCLVHDRFFQSEGAQPFPGPAPRGNRHVGQDEYTARRRWQAQWLAPWIASHACLSDTPG